MEIVINRRKGTMREKIIDVLKSAWYSNFMIQQYCKSSSADRSLRNIREYPPQGYKVIQRQKEGCDCLEYMLVEVENEEVC